MWKYDACKRIGTQQKLNKILSTSVIFFVNAFYDCMLLAEWMCWDVALSFGITTNSTRNKSMDVLVKWKTAQRFTTNIGTVNSFFRERESKDPLHFDLFVQKSREKYIFTECCADAVIIMAFTWIEWTRRRDNASPFLQFLWILCSRLRWCFDANSTIVTVHYEHWLNTWKATVVDTCTLVESSLSCVMVHQAYCAFPKLQ